MAQAFVHEIPEMRIEAGMLVVDFRSGDDVVSVAMTRHAAMGMLQFLPSRFEAFNRDCELITLAQS